MKVCIVTVYNSENCGSFWQAKALKDFCIAEGNTVCHLKRDVTGTSHDKKLLFINSVKAILKGRFSRVGRYIKKYRSFEKAINDEFDLIDQIDDSVDLCILGSDTIWELQDDYFRRLSGIYWGYELNCDQISSYAPSVANTGVELVEKYRNIVEHVDELVHVSVRDRATKMLLQPYSRKEISIVCDPTLLFDKEYYLTNSPAIKDEHFLLVYYFGKMDKQREENIVRFAREKNLSIISIGESMSQCDKMVEFDPYYFVSLYNHAAYVITNTFHGTLFSITFRKQFVSFCRGKRKTEEILIDLGLKERIVDDAMMNKKIGEEIDYRTIEPNLERLRKQSIEYLKQVLMKKE